jgi:hypothetical protein
VRGIILRTASDHIAKGHIEMTRKAFATMTALVLLCSASVMAGPEETAQADPLPNMLGEQERQDGWKLLWDGKTTQGWRSTHGDHFPEIGWTIEDGELVVLPAEGDANHSGGDIITVDKFRNFELSLEFKLSEGANSGIKYFMDPNIMKERGSAIGLEYAIVDDATHPDAKMGVAGNRGQGALYDLIPPGLMLEPEEQQKLIRPIGEWNEARIVVKGKRVEHWLNGTRVLDFRRGTSMFRALVANSKYAGRENFGEWRTTPILLQDHGDRVAFRSIKIREL